MAKMTVHAVFEFEDPNATPEQMQEHEKMARQCEPFSLAACGAIMGAVLTVAGKEPGTLTGHITHVEHE